MASRLKEDEKNERVIRGLLKLPENRRCINCNSLGSQYVCTNFWTFVCTTCSGIHREFTHRVKSVSMAKFTSQEVISLQEGGNKRAKEVYFKEWDSQHHSIPDSSNVDRLRDFIKHVYVDRRYSSERNFDKPPRVKMGDREDSNETKRADTYQGGSRSPPYEDTYERRYSDRSSPGGRNYGERSLGYDQESRQYGDHKKSPARPEVVNDWRQEDRFGNERRYEDRRISDGDAKVEGRSPERPKDLDTASPPMVRPVREILGDNIVPLRISEPPKANGGRTADGSAHTQRTASSSSLGSTNGNPAEVKWESSGSLIDFDAEPEPPAAAAVPQTQQPTVMQSAAIPTSSPNDNNWASFDFAPGTNVTQAPLNSLDSVLAQLSVPASVPGHMSGVAGGMGTQTTGSVGNDATVGPAGFTMPISVGAPAAAPNSSFSTFPPSGAPAAVPGLMQMLPTPGGQWPGLQHQQPSMFPASGVLSNFAPFGGAISNQQWNLSPALSAQGSLSTPAVSKPAQGLTSGVASQTTLEVKSSERKVLPEDLFSFNYSSMPASVPGWQVGPPHGMGFSMQYNTAAPLPAYSQSSKSTNPFDVGNESSPVQAPVFPSMVSMQGALPNMPAPSGLHRTSSLGTPSPTWMQPQPSSYASVMAPQGPPYASALPPQVPSNASAMPPRPYMGQVPTNMMPSRPQGLGGLGTKGASFGPLNPDQMAGRYSAPATPNPFSSAGGNPFG